MKTALQLTNSLNRSHVRLIFLLIPLACVALSPQARATCQEGCLTNENTVLGEDALLTNTGHSNTAIGFQALSSNTAASDNTAIGFQALFRNTTGIENTANGYNTLFSNTNGRLNTAIGLEALYSNATGTDNTAVGVNALFFNTTGNNNTASGYSALFNNTGSGNIALGASAGENLTTGSNNIDIGNRGVAAESNAIRIGRKGTHEATFIAGISGVPVAGGVTVIVNANGRLGTIVSSERFKKEIKPMGKASEAILALQPVTFRYKEELDPDGIPQFGLVAEQVEKVNPDLVARDDQGKPYMVRYEAVNAMLLNEFLKEHRKVEEQEATIAALKAGDAQHTKAIAQLKELVTEQAKQIQEVDRKSVV